MAFQNFQEEKILSLVLYRLFVYLQQLFPLPLYVLAGPLFAS